MIAGVNNPFAVHAGLATLKRRGSAADAALKKRGQDIYAGPNVGTRSGYWIGIQIDPKNRALSGGATRRLNSFVEGY
jgi:hypothetical protein